MEIQARYQTCHGHQEVPEVYQFTPEEAAIPAFDWGDHPGPL